MKTLVFAGHFINEQAISKIKELGLDVDLIYDEKAPVAYPEQYEAVICSSLFRYSSMRDFSNLRFVQLVSAGIEGRIDMDFVREKNIIWHRAEDVMSIPIAEHIIMSILMLYRGQRVCDEAQHSHQWLKRNSTKYRELTGRNVCIVGAGFIGTECAKKFKAFDCYVTGMARSAGPRKHFDNIYTTDAIKEVVAESDIVVSALPLSDETYHYFNEDFFNTMKKRAVFVNISRGAVADEAALANALDSGQISGAVLDVFEKEPLEYDAPFWDMENVILTPHCSSRGEHGQERFLQCLERNLKAFFAEQKG